LYQLARHPYDTLIAPAMERLPTVPKAVMEGRFTDAANAVAGSVPLIGPASEAISAQVKSGDTAGGLGSLTALMAGPKVFKTAGQGMNAVARGGARLVMDAPAATRAAALENRAMPGVFRSGEARAASRLTGASDDLSRAIAGHEQTPVTMGHLAYMPDVFTQVGNVAGRAGPGHAAVNRVIRDVQSNIAMKPRPTVGAARDIAAGTYEASRGRSVSPTVLAQRAIADNIMREIPRVVPSAAPQAQRYAALQDVAAAHARPRPTQGAAGALPTIQARVAAFAAQRLLSPTLQGMNYMSRVGTKVPPEALRAMMMAELFKGSGREDE
jgi:hypothetical protein